MTDAEMVERLTEEVSNQRNKTLADLRAKVEALPAAKGRTVSDIIYRSDVLALIDGEEY